MSHATVSPISRLKLAVIPLLLLTLSACASNFNSKVTRFSSQLPAPQGQTFAVVADDPALAGGLEFAQYARLVEARMQALGYTPAPAETATMLVRFEYGVDKGRERVRQTPGFYDPYWSSWYGPRAGYWGYRRRGGWHGPSSAWGYGWYDPWFDGGYEQYTVYTSGISLKIDRKADGQRLFEGKAEAASLSNRLGYLVPNLVEAMFTDFPGNSGETVRISVAPEKKRGK
ncbi:MAG: DUF4136 domain-containing protein [Novosphingobium sp.]|jgi:hypothetical protein|nr:DUF4136 domain-containing protein [Brevundimonas sp.]